MKTAILERYEKAIKLGPTEVCKVCGQVFFNKSVLNLSDKNKEQIHKYCINRMLAREDCKICRTCLNYVKRDKMPPMALMNGLEFPPIPEPLIGLTWEEVLPPWFNTSRGAFSERPPPFHECCAFRSRSAVGIKRTLHLLSLIHI